MMTYWQAGILVILGVVVISLLPGCAGSGFAPPVEERRRDPPETYVVVRGDTLYGIAWRYGLDYRQVAIWNRLDQPDLIHPGQRLRLRPPESKTPSRAPPAIALQGRSVGPTAETAPVATASSDASRDRFADAHFETEARVSTPTASDSARSDPGARPWASGPEPNAGQLAWLWPTKGKVVRGYDPNIPGRRGIHIGGELGQVVWAASPGQVVYSGSGLPGYGRLIIVKHSDVLLSAYGYLGNIFVKEGDNIEIGQPIAEMGANSENQPALHFEIRQNGKPADPLQFLPG